MSASGHSYIVTEYHGQGSLADHIAKSGPLPWTDALHIGIKLARALDTAHRAGVLHRDVKPANVLISDYGEPLLADFGVARLADATRHSKTMLAFTAAYAPPEVLAGQSASEAGDIYSLAATIFELLAGTPPFDAPEDGVFASSPW